MLTGPVRVMIGAQHQVTSPFLVKIWLIGEARMQGVVATSSAEAEYRSMALGICEILWLILLLQDLECQT